MKITAWMKINEPAFSIIQPLMYKKIDNYLGKINKQSVLASIIDFKMEMKLDGYYEKPEGVDLNKNPFYGIGMIEFHRRFDEIMEFFSKKLKNKKFQYDHIMENRRKIFVTKIPIYSAILRDVFFTNEEWSYTKIDRQFNALYSNVSKLNEEKHISNQNIAKLNKNLFRAQSNLNKAWDLIFVSLHENEGLNQIGHYFFNCWKLLQKTISSVNNCVQRLSERSRFKQIEKLNIFVDKDIVYAL